MAKNILATSEIRNAGKLVGEQGTRRKRSKKSALSLFGLSRALTRS